MRQSSAHVTRGRRVAWTFALLALPAVLLGTAASPAAAHDVLESTEPADGAVLTAAPEQVVLTFSAEQAGVGAEVVVTGPGDTSWSEGVAAVAGSTVTQALADGMPDGAYTVSWRSVAQDGHPVTGSFGFTVASPEPQPTAEPTDEVTDEPQSEPEADPETVPPTDEVEVTAAPLTGTSDEPAETEDGTTRWVLGVVAVLVVAAALAAGLAARRRRGRAPEEPGDEGSPR